MIGVDWLTFLFATVILIFGILIGIFFVDSSSPPDVGTLVVDHSDPYSTNLFLEVTTNPDFLENASVVKMTVVHKNYVIESR